MGDIAPKPPVGQHSVQSRTNALNFKAHVRSRKYMYIHYRPKWLQHIHIWYFFFFSFLKPDPLSNSLSVTEVQHKNIVCVSSLSSRIWVVWSNSCWIVLDLSLPNCTSGHATTIFADSVHRKHELSYLGKLISQINSQYTIYSGTPVVVVTADIIAHQVLLNWVPEQATEDSVKYQIYY